MTTITEKSILISNDSLEYSNINLLKLKNFIMFYFKFLNCYWSWQK